MINQTRITSQFDIELLLSERYIKYFLLTSFETGSIPWFVDDVDDVTGAVTHIIVHPPEELRENRLYPPHPDFVPHPFLDLVPIDYTSKAGTCDVTLLTDDTGADIRGQMTISIILPEVIPGNGPIIITEQTMTFDAKFAPIADVDPNGFQKNVRIHLELVDITGPFPDKAKALKKMKAAMDRDLPLSIIGDGGAINQIATRKFFAEDTPGAPTCLAIYVNLNLKNGPEPDAFYGARGDLTLAQNFLPPGEHLAFGFASGLYPMVGNDIFQRMARTKPGGGFYYPLDPDDPSTGHVTSASILPQSHGHTTSTGGSDTQYDNILVVQVRGEVFVADLPFDPDFTMSVYLAPSIDHGVLTFAVSYDLNIPATGWVILGAALLSFVSLGLGIPATIATLVARAIVEDHFEGEAIPRIQNQLDDASLLSAFPNKLAIEQRRWDPGYFTLHQIVGLVKTVAINDQGMAFSAYDLRVGKEPKVLDDAIIRSETRAPNGDLSGLLYRISDFTGVLAGDLKLLFPATDRMEFVEIVPAAAPIEATRLHLTVEQAVDRIASERLVGQLLYNPYKIDEEAHQIYQILVLSKIEVPEIQQRARSLLRQELNTAHGSEFRQQAHDQLFAELGREPTADEVTARFNEILAAAVDAGAAKRYRKEREFFLKFDLEPFEFASLQQKKILVLEHFILQIVKIRDSEGGTVYYRDKADADVGDNLLKLPRYKSQKIVRTS
ncbi:MAG: hypothetical protein ABJD11_11705 [Gemmatimonadota bacterium]